MSNLDITKIAALFSGPASTDAFGWRDELLNALNPTPIVNVTSLTGDTITVASPDDVTYNLTPAGTLATLNFVLPAAVNARIGQKVTIFSTQIVTALTVTIAASGTNGGTALTTLAVKVAHQWQCISISGTVATWALMY